MIKKIKARDARLGMYIHEIRGSWLEHPFWRKSFKLESQKDLNTLLRCNFDELWIDTQKGLDVQAELIVDETVIVSVEQETIVEDPIPEPVKPAKPVRKAIVQTSLDEELSTAKTIHHKAKQVVTSMFNEVRMGNALEIQGAEALVEEINQSIVRNPNALLSLTRLKNADEYTYLHSVAVCMLMIALAKQLDLDETQVQQAGMAGLLHDVGKMAIPNEVLNKSQKLSDHEFALIKQHPQRGWEILKACYQVEETVLDVCLHHHERVDGRGYPDKLSGDQLSLSARMGAVCDVYDAISSDRCYKKAWGPAESIRKMAAWCDGHFDEVVFHAFVKTIGIYPNGTLVKLKSGRLGVVIEQSRKSLTTPILKVFFSTSTDAPVPIEIIDLSKTEDKIDSIEDPQKWQLDISRVQGIT